jgi:hypothetical protein
LKNYFRGGKTMPETKFYQTPHAWETIAIVEDKENGTISISIARAGRADIESRRITAESGMKIAEGRTRKASQFKNQPQPTHENYVIVRTYSAGVFAGTLEKREGREVTLRNARRIWYWDGAASLSQLAMEGTNKPNQCKFPQSVDKVLLLEAIEIINCTQKAINSIAEVPVWKK